MQVWNVLHGAHCKYRKQKVIKKSPSGHHRTILTGYIFATKARIDNQKKKLLSSNNSSTCSHNIVNFGPLAAEIDPVVWSTPANFNGFRVLAALLHGTPVLGVSQTLRREQRVPPIFSRAAITMGIGPHSSFQYFFASMQFLHQKTLWLPWLIRMLKQSNSNSLLFISSNSSTTITNSLPLF